MQIICNSCHYSEANQFEILWHLQLLTDFKPFTFVYDAFLDNDWKNRFLQFERFK